MTEYLIPSMQVKLLKFFFLIFLKCTVDHGQQYIAENVQHNNQKDYEEQWGKWFVVIRFHHDIRKAVRMHNRIVIAIHTCSNAYVPLQYFCPHK